MRMSLLRISLMAHLKSRRLTNDHIFHNVDE